MTYTVYAMRDVKTGFLTPTIEVNDEAAKRNFIHSLWNSEGILHSFAADFSLYKIGSFDSDAGSITSEPVPVHLLSGTDALIAGSQQEEDNYG